MTYHHLTRSERSVIQSLSREGFSNRKIARILKRDPSTIGRELSRNKYEGSYEPYLANWLATSRRKWTRCSSKLQDAPLMEYVDRCLEDAWSPQQISGRLRRMEQLGQSSMQISHETIYRHVRNDRKQNGTLFMHLRHGRRKYDKRLAPCSGRGRIKDRVSIDERPLSVAQQLHFGDWEADTIHGKDRKGYVATIIERKSLYLQAFTLPDLKAASLNKAFTEGLKDIDKDLCRTITCDNGSEFSGFKEIEQKLGCTVYFANPYHAWERGVNENVNGLLRQFIPKKSNINNITQAQLDHFVEMLNSRPRRKLGYRTPNEVFNEARIALQT